MKVLVYAVRDDLDEIAKDLAVAIESGLPEANLNEGVQPYLDEETGHIGVTLMAKKANHLQAPLNWLQILAKQFKCDFAVAIVEDGEEPEDVCFFGNEEGKPDTFEIACYLGL